MARRDACSRSWSTAWKTSTSSCSWPPDHARRQPETTCSTNSRATRGPCRSVPARYPSRPWPRSTLVRLATLPSGALALAQAVAVLGDGAAVHHAAQLAALELGTATDAADA